MLRQIAFLSSLVPWMIVGLGILPYNTSQAKSSLEHTSDIFNRRLEDSHAPMTGRGTPHQKLWEAARFKVRANRFLLQGRILYKKSFTHPLLRCMSQPKGIHILKEIHSGCCGAHASTWILTNKALRVKYFWPTMKQDAQQLVDKCKKCQKHSSLIHQPVEPLTTMLSPCPFAQWGMDIVGPFPLALG
ncbi:UNVERIFIED_CONTAM: hypothetical protein Scaly_2227100 [Sesamum calycinum]|uniref:Integrase zinc-binding domain-containing protein n=1 Tax=Sesamum calycinum TaxID=2727403 RepID=A0AAW2M958_9LAMI